MKQIRVVNLEIEEVKNLENKSIIFRINISKYMSYNAR